MLTAVFAVALFFAAAVSSLFGQGGGALYTPVQLWLGVPARQAAAQSLFLIVITSISSTAVFRSRLETDWGLCFILEVPTTLGAAFSGFLSAVLPREILGLLLCALLLIAAGAVRFSYESVGAAVAPRPANRRFPGLIVRRYEGGTYCLNLWIVVPVMAGVGLLTGAVGLGGGILKLPLMVLVFGIPWRIAVGSSAFMVGLTALSGLISHSYVGHMTWNPSLLIYGVAVFAGAQIGSRVSHVIDQESLRAAYSWFLAVAALVTLVRILFLPPVDVP